MRYFLNLLPVLILGILPVPAASDDLFFDAAQWGSANLVSRQSSGSRSLESIVSANNNLERLNSYNEGERLRNMSRPVGRLDIRFANGSFTTCTATIIANDKIITNSHCIPNLPGTIQAQGAITDASLVMNYYDERNTSLAVPYRVNSTPLETNPSLDYSILEVEGTPGLIWGIARMRAEPPQDGSTLLVIHHPGGLPKHVTRGQCRAARPATNSSGVELFHLCDTLPGSSGAPIFSDNDGMMIGIHRAGPTIVTADSTNYGITLSAIDSDIIPRSSLQGNVESVTRTVTRPVYNGAKDPIHIGDEHFRVGSGRDWTPLVGQCHTFSMDTSYGKPKRLIINARVYGAENTSVILDGQRYPFANQQIPADKVRPNYWSRPIQVYISPGEDAQYLGQLQVCSDLVRAPEKPGDLDDFMIRDVVIFGDFEES